MVTTKGHAMNFRRHVIRILCLLGLWLGLGLQQVHAQTDTVTYVYTDPQGTPLVEADASGNVITRYDYTPYGNAVASLGNPPDGPGYTGHVNDPETGLVYMQARYYQPIGRFLSPDPIGPVAGNLYSFNRYAYANNNPITNIDPTGAYPSGLTGNQIDCAVYNCQTYGDAPDQPPTPPPSIWDRITKAGSNWLHQTTQDLATVGGGKPPASLVEAILAPLRLTATFSPFALEGGGFSLAAAGAESSAGSASFAVEGASTSVFWSGGDAARAAAENWAAANGGTTLEMTVQGQATQAAMQGADWLTEARPAWVSASSNFANSAYGDVHVFQGGVISTQSVWATTEYPALMANPNVTRIIYHGVGW